MRVSQYHKNLREEEPLKNYTYRLTKTDHDKLSDIAETLNVQTTVLVRTILRTFIAQNENMTEGDDEEDGWFE